MFLYPIKIKREDMNTITEIFNQDVAGVIRGFMQTRSYFIATNDDIGWEKILERAESRDSEDISLKVTWEEKDASEDKWYRLLVTGRVRRLTLSIRRERIPLMTPRRRLRYEDVNSLNERFPNFYKVFTASRKHRVNFKNIPRLDALRVENLISPSSSYPSGKHPFWPYKNTREESSTGVPYDKLGSKYVNGWTYLKSLSIGDLRTVEEGDVYYQGYRNHGKMTRIEDGYFAGLLNLEELKVDTQYYDDLFDHFRFKRFGPGWNSFNGEDLPALKTLSLWLYEGSDFMKLKSETLYGKKMASPTLRHLKLYGGYIEHGVYDCSMFYPLETLTMVDCFIVDSNEVLKKNDNNLFNVHVRSCTLVRPELNTDARLPEQERSYILSLLKSMTRSRIQVLNMSDVKISSRRASLERACLSKGLLNCEHSIERISLKSSEIGSVDINITDTKWLAVTNL
jgi:hypothetical protein